MGTLRELEKVAAELNLARRQLYLLLMSDPGIASVIEFYQREAVQRAVKQRRAEPWHSKRN